MHSRFLEAIETLDVKFQLLLSSQPLKFGLVPTSIPKSGVYLFSDGEKHLYVGRSNRLRERYFLHCRRGSKQNQASFAFKLAKEVLGIGPASYKIGSGTRVGLSGTDEFKSAFDSAKARIRSMNYRFVEETDQVKQALLESYCAIALCTPYNDFDTH